MFYALPGDITLVNPDEVHTGTSATPGGYRYRADLLTALSEGTCGVPFFNAPVVHDPTLYTALLHLHAALAEPTFTLERDTRLLTVLGTLTARYAGGHTRSHRDPGLAGRVRERLQADVGQDVPLALLAALFSVTPHHLVRSFTRAFGMPPHAYQVQLRVSLARRLLRSGVPLARAAVEAGFYDQSHLGRHFKRILGVTPAQHTASVRSTSS